MTDDNSDNASQSRLKEFLAIPEAPKREKKHRNYKQQSYAVLTAGERLQELRNRERMKEETEKMRKEKAEERLKKKYEAEEEKKVKQQRIHESKIKREVEKVKLNEMRQKRAEEKLQKQELKRKQKAEMEEKKKIKKQMKTKPESKKLRQPLASLLVDENGSGELFVDEPEEAVNFFDISEEVELNAVLGLDLVAGSSEQL